MAAPLANSHSTGLELQAAIARLQSDYWARVDAIDPGAPDALFTDDAVFELGTLVLRGRDQLRLFFDKRRADDKAAGRTTRHLAMNLRVTAVDPRRAETVSSVMMMSGHGEWPIASTLPSIGDFADVCVQRRDGAWLFERRRATSVFVAPNAAAFAKGKQNSEE